MLIKEIAIEPVWELRHKTMYPDQPEDAVKLPDDDAGLHLGLYEKGELISVISVFERGDEWQFRKFATAIPQQRQGYGSVLLQEVFNRARKAGKKRIWCNARCSATGFYEKFGMQATGDTWEKYGILFIKMEKATGHTVMEIIPAIDIIDGKCVRLTQGDYAQKKEYDQQPLELAKQFEGAGIKRLHLVDLDGARNKAVKNWKVLESIATKTGLVIDFGGGIATKKDLQIVFESGAAMATVGSIAVNNETELLKWMLQFGAERFLLGADVKDKMIAIHGWLETTDRGVLEFIKHYIDRGVQQVFCTDVSKDGKLEGPSLKLYEEIIADFPGLHFIASGGVSTLDDLHALKEIGCKGVIVGKAIYENRISLDDLKIFL